jgi:hypothetical protein
MILELSCHIFKKCSNIKFYKNPSNGRRVVPRERTDEHAEASRRFIQFCKRPEKYFQRIYLSNKIIDIIFILFIIWCVTLNTNNNSFQSSKTIVFINTAA